MAQITRQRIVATARRWVGTPYRHQASCRGAGADCLGLIRGVYRELYDAPLGTPPAYARFANRGDAETVWAAAKIYLNELNAPPHSGDVLLFRLRPHFPARHLAILTRTITPRMVHATSGLHVCEVSYSEWWRERLVASFAFPNI